MCIYEQLQIGEGSGGQGSEWQRARGPAPGGAGGGGGGGGGGASPEAGEGRTADRLHEMLPVQFSYKLMVGWSFSS